MNRIGHGGRRVERAHAYMYLRRFLPPTRMVIVRAGRHQLAEPQTRLRSQQSATWTRKLSWLPENSVLGWDALLRVDLVGGLWGRRVVVRGSWRHIG